MKPSSETWLALEAERVDQFWRRGVTFAPTKVGLTRAEQRMFFEAGRFAAGARDSRAKAGNRRAIEFARQ